MIVRGSFFIALVFLLAACPETDVIRLDGGACAETCTGATPVCDFATSMCVGCVTSHDCEGATPLCDPETKTCGPCGTASECVAADIGRPICSITTGRCVQCLSDEQCGGETPSCNTVSGLCEGCVSDGDCLDPLRGRCDVETLRCSPCTADLDCARFAATPVCDESRGACVACTGDTEAARCGPNACRRSDGVCTDVPRQSLERCDVCEADSQCGPGQWCMPQSFDGAPQGYACLPEPISGSCASVHMMLRPFAMLVVRESVDGQTRSVCDLSTATTCAARRDFGTACLDDDDCGVPGIDDGACGTVLGEPNLCTYPCGASAQCPEASSCSGSSNECE